MNIFIFPCSWILVSLLGLESTFGSSYLQVHSLVIPRCLDLCFPSLSGLSRSRFSLLKDTLHLSFAMAALRLARLCHTTPSLLLSFPSPYISRCPAPSSRSIPQTTPLSRHIVYGPSPLSFSSLRARGYSSQEDGAVTVDAAGRHHTPIVDQLWKLRGSHGKHDINS